MEILENTHLNIVINERILFFDNEIERVQIDIENPDLFEGKEQNELIKQELESGLSFWERLNEGDHSEEVLDRTIKKFLGQEIERLNHVTEKYSNANNGELKSKFNGDMQLLMNRIKTIKFANQEIIK